MHESLRLVNNTCGVLWNSPLIFIVSCHLGRIRQVGDILEVVRIGFGTCRQIVYFFRAGVMLLGWLGDEVVHVALEVFSG